MNLSRRLVLAGIGAAIAAPAPALARDRLHEVAIRDFAFDPVALSVRTGDRIRFTNHDLAPHSATALNESWDTGELNTGDSAEITVSADWMADYYCVFHPTMTGFISLETD